jgi:hypothetical protein
MIGLDRWIKKRDPAASRPEAIRRLVELGLKVKKWAQFHGLRKTIKSFWV